MRDDIRKVKETFPQMRAGVSSNVMKIFRSLYPTQSDNEILKDLHNKNISIMTNEKEDIAFTKLYKNINECEPINNQKKNGFRSINSRKKHLEAEKKAIEFHEICQDNSDLFNYTQDYKLTTYLTVLGFKPSCLIPEYLAKSLINLNHPLFENFTYITLGSENKERVQFFNPENVRKLINKYPDIFNNHDETKKIDDNFRTITATNYDGKSSISETKDSYYLKHIRSGLLLGMPYPLAVEFAAYQSYLDNYMKCDDEYYNLCKLSQAFYDDMFDEVPEKPLSIIKENYNALRNPIKLERERKEREKAALSKVPKELPNAEVAKVISTLRIIRISQDLWVNAYSHEPVNRNYLRTIYQYVNLLEGNYIKNYLKKQILKKYGIQKTLD